MTALTIPLKSSLIKFPLQAVKVARKITVSRVLEICSPQKFTKTQNSVNNCEGEGWCHEAVDFAQTGKFYSTTLCAFPQRARAEHRSAFLAPASQAPRLPQLLRPRPWVHPLPCQSFLSSQFLTRSFLPSFFLGSLLVTLSDNRCCCCFACLNLRNLGRKCYLCRLNWKIVLHL